ncbi:MAG: DUF721 domain-containing protein [Bacteroidetes bacterium]|nr:DUF721 domain-containing protein [Bacteroidota bacterium]MCY4204878.1 DUF721 domain-containing protein [Bacteroidota bacterium]
MDLNNPSDPFTLSDLIDLAIDDLGLRAGVDEAEAVEVWQDLAGPIIANVTEQVWTRRGKLYVELNSGTWRQELHMDRVKWRKRLNETLGKRVIHEIIFH